MEEQKPKTQEELAQEFLNEYKALCEKHGLTISITPEWRFSNETGDYRMVLKQGLVILKKQESK